MNNQSTIGLAVLVLILTPIIWALPVQLCWNFGLAPAIEGVNQITFWQAMLISLLFNMLSGSTSVSKKD